MTRLVRSDDQLDHLLAAIARTTSESLGYGTVAVHLYRPEQDDFCTTTVHGSELARETLLGDSRGWDVWGAVLDARFLHRPEYSGRSHDHGRQCQRVDRAFRSGHGNGNDAAVVL